LNFLFAWRYFKAKKSTNAINIIAWISITAMMFGTAALILVLSVFNGFEGLVKSLYSAFYTDLKILPVQGKVIRLTEEQLRKIKAIREIKNFSLVAEEKALLQNGEYQTVVYLKGVDENYENVTDVPKYLVKRNFSNGDTTFSSLLGNADFPSLILGAGIENAVGVQAEMNLLPLVVYLPKRGASELLDPLKNIGADTVTTTGAFVIQQDFDNKYALTNLAFVKNMLGMEPDEYSGLEIVLNDPDDVKDVKNQLGQMMGSAYSVQTRYEQNRGLYSVMQAEKWVIYAVLCLILIVAAFNMIGALTMLVLEKEKDISVLHALGGNKNFIQKIFLTEGLLLAIIGGGVGMLLALIIALLQINFKLIPLEGGSFLIDYFPVILQLKDFLLVGATVLVIALLASWIPSRKAAAQEFSLRSE
jgi:lipoprotein-releasing system permease protein